MSEKERRFLIITNFRFHLVFQVDLVFQFRTYKKQMCLGERKATWVSLPTDGSTTHKYIMQLENSQVVDFLHHNPTAKIVKNPDDNGHERESCQMCIIV